MREVKHQSATHHDSFQSQVVGNLIVMDAKIGTRDWPQATDDVFRRVIGSTVPRPSLVLRRACVSQGVFRNAARPVLRSLAWQVFPPTPQSTAI